MSAELLKAALVARCRATPERTIENRTVSLTTACSVLGAWNTTYDLDSRGAVLWREFVTQFRGPDFTRAGKLFARDQARAFDREKLLYYTGEWHEE